MLINLELNAGKVGLFLHHGDYHLEADLSKYFINSKSPMRILKMHVLYIKTELKHLFLYIINAFIFV